MQRINWRLQLCGDMLRTVYHVTPMVVLKCSECHLFEILDCDSSTHPWHFMSTEFLHARFHRHAPGTSCCSGSTRWSRTSSWKAGRVSILKWMWVQNYSGDPRRDRCLADACCKFTSCVEIHHNARPIRDPSQSWADTRNNENNFRVALRRQFQNCTM